MALIDLTADQLPDYRPERQEPTDFDEFWRDTLTAAAYGTDPVFAPVATALTEVEVQDVTFPGWAGEPVKAWLLLPRHRSGPLPCVVEYLGYGCGRATPYQWLVGPASGYATFVMDNRGQGSYLPGDTADSQSAADGHSGSGHLLRGLAGPAGHYYRRLTTDAVRAVDVVRAHPAVDPDRVAVVGTSQGGGLALAVGGLRTDLAAVVAQVPFLCHYRRATEVTDSDPYAEITRYCRANPHRVESVLTTLSYFDSVNHAARISAPTLVTVALMDDVCPPSTTMAAFHHCAADKELVVWPYGDHGHGETHAAATQLDFLSRRLAD